MAFTKIVTVLVVTTVFISLVSSQNCTNNEFIVGGVCKTCGDNSNSNIDDRAKCPCISKHPPYKRLPKDVKDYTKPCYQFPSEPRNVTVFKKNSTEIIYRWEEPETNDKHLPTKFSLLFGKCIENKCKMQTVTGNSGQDTEYVNSRLTPRTTYHFIVCAFNDVSESKPACVDPNHMPAVRTLDGKPGKFANFELQFSNGSEYYYFFFPPPNHWGEKQITVKISCEDEAKTTKSKNLTETNLKEKYDIQVPRICAKTVRCSIYAANTKGKGESLSKIFTINDDCKVDCTNNEFIVGGVCETCGDNSNSNIDRTECPCISKVPPYKRLPKDVKDYTKPCYRFPSEPRNVTVFKKNSTEIIYRWQEPETNDKHLPTKFSLLFGKCIENKCRMVNVTGNSERDTEYVNSGLTPRTTYHFMVCAFNNVSESKPACVDPNHMPAVRTLDGS